MRQRELVSLILIVLLFGISVWVDWPQRPENYFPNVIPWPRSQGIHIGGFDRQGFRLGLDLQGGTDVQLEADLSQVPPDQRGDALRGAVNVIERRVNAFGVSETVIQTLGDNRISVQLPGVRDKEEAVRLIGKTAQLEFRERPAGAPQDGSQDKPVDLTGKDLKRAEAGLSPQTNLPVVNFEFNDHGAQVFGELTTRLAGTGGQIVILLDGQELTAPVVRQPITGGRGLIEGNFTIDSAKTLAIQLNAGALPVPVKIVKQQDVDATLGADSIRKSVFAGELGLLAVLVFMILYYRLPGVLASAALIIYAALVLAVFKLIPVTLTLAGIAAFILSIGMAVDANILIFERMREELRAGRTLGGAIEAGFARAWTSIRDSNISTLITAGILIWFGSTFGASVVVGFAIALAISVLVSMFTAIFVTRTFLRVIQETWLKGTSPEAQPRIRWLFGLHADEAPKAVAGPRAGVEAAR